MGAVVRGDNSAMGAGLFLVFDSQEELGVTAGRNIGRIENEGVDRVLAGGDESGIHFHHIFSRGAAVGEMHVGVGQGSGLERIVEELHGHLGVADGGAAHQGDFYFLKRLRIGEREAARGMEKAVFVDLTGRSIGPSGVLAARYGNRSDEKTGGEEGEDMKFHCVSV